MSTADRAQTIVDSLTEVETSTVHAALNEVTDAVGLIRNVLVSGVDFVSATGSDLTAEVDKAQKALATVAKTLLGK